MTTTWPDRLVLGAVAYDPKVVTIWEGFKDYFTRHGLPFDYILYSNYEAQGEARHRLRSDLGGRRPRRLARADRRRPEGEGGGRRRGRLATGQPDPAGLSPGAGPDARGRLHRPAPRRPRRQARRPHRGRARGRPVADGGHRRRRLPDRGEPQP